LFTTLSYAHLIDTHISAIPAFRIEGSQLAIELSFYEYSSFYKILA